jgi:hypothetical protein
MKPPHTALPVTALGSWPGQNLSAAYRDQRDVRRGPVQQALIDEVNLDAPHSRQVLEQCVLDLTGCPAATLPELAFRLARQRLLAELPPAHPFH